MKYLLPFLVLLASLTAVSAVNPPTASASDVQFAIDNTPNGGTVTLPAGQSATWTTQVSFTKGITLDFNGCEITRNMTSSGAPILQATAVANFTTRITNGTFLGGKNAPANTFEGRYMIISSVSGGKMRLDNCFFAPSGVVSVEANSTAGETLIDHCVFEAGGGSFDPDEIIHVEAYGPGSLTGWNNDITQGSYDAVYIEDCDFNWTGPAGGVGANACMQMYYGARVVFRYNRVRGAVWDCHGDSTPHSGRWYEIYENDFYHSSAQGYSDKVFQVRGGSGVIFNNRLHRGTGAAGTPGITLWNENVGNPAPCQVGSGKNQTPNNHSTQGRDPIYIWNNTQESGGAPSAMPLGTSYAASSSPGGTPGAIQLGRDYVLADKRLPANGGYIPAPYPHTLQGAVPPTPTVAEPVISPAAGPYFGTVTVSMTGLTSGANYYYTLDGSTPTASSTRYTGPFTLSTTGTTTVRTVGIKTGETNSGGTAFSPGIAYEINSWSVQGSGVFKTIQLPAQTGSFTWNFRARTTTAVADAVIGMGPDAVTSNTGMGALLLFTQNGQVQVRDGATYRADAVFNYIADTNYDVVAVINQSTHRVTSVRVNGTLIATDYAFRTEQAASADSEWVGMRCNSGTLSLSNMTITPAPAVAGTYYVSKDTPGAVDSPGQPGTEAAPFASINYAVTRIAAGDDIIVKEATTPYNVVIGSDVGLFITGPNGTSTNPCTIRAYPGHQPQLVGGGASFFTVIALTGVSWWEIEGLDMSNATNIAVIRTNSSNITFRNNNLHDSGNQIVWITTNSSNILFDSNTLANGGILGTQNGEGFYIGTHNGGTDFTNNVTIQNNTIVGMEHEGIDLKHDTHDIVIQDNIVANCVTNFNYGKWSIYANPMNPGRPNPNHIIRRNVISGQGGMTEGAAIGIETGAQVYNNVVHSVVSPAYAVNINGGDSFTRYVWNNTLDVPVARAIFNQGGTSSIGNNIGPATTTGTNNLPVSSTYFVDYAGHDYNLVAGATPINYGTTPPFPITTDIEGENRTGNNDAGAYEFIGVAPDTTPPSTPTFSTAPTADTSYTITMEAAESIDATSPPVEYWFDETSGNPGGTDSGWLSTRTYTDTGLTPGVQYTYRVKARDSAPALNESAYSSTANATPPMPVAEPQNINCETLNVTTLRVGP